VTPEVIFKSFHMHNYVDQWVEDYGEREAMGGKGETFLLYSFSNSF
jgi:hypothetical protein